MKLELWGGRRDDDQEPNYANRWGWLVAPDRLRGVTKHARRLVKIGLVPANSAEISVCKERDLDAATHDAPGIDHRCSRGRRDGHFGRTSGTPAATADEPPARPAATGSLALSLVGKSETELRDVLGAPTSEEDRPPVNFGAIETDNAPWLSSSTRTFRQNSSVLLRTR